ncbi:hypothetical protein TRFO_10780 [Tritrichomonas foetus]|uniref:Uncharacterized protein n=1 Tax=Tritrichomonas foetus TaxID=1144522 RepID=A0A1J4J9D7_9EUKA|nr:hypothetical protein TRFO_10780 [Tritrichomonas foetus]|eukprot:OHS94863.1 hypothetical protein TRFO_10780 [Tritrichomonas foetus]
MGIFFSSAQATVKTAEDFGKVPSEIAGLTATSDEIMYFTKDSFCEIRTIDDSLATRILSMAPSCVCASSIGTFIIGFKSGYISEFDTDLNLLTTFTIPGGFRAHNGEILQLVSSLNCYLLSIGSDKTLNFWNFKGLHLSALTSTGSFTALCCSHDYAWLSDLNQRMHIIDLHTRERIRSFNLPGIVVSMSSFGDGRGCIASLKDGSLNIYSTFGVLAHLPFLNHPPVISICPLRIDPQNGLISYAAVDSKGNLSLRVLEYIVKDLGQGAPFFAVNDKEVVAVINGQLLRLSKDKLETESMKSLPEMELPREKIKKFLLNEIEEEEEDEDEMIEEEDLPSFLKGIEKQENFNEEEEYNA